MNDEYLAWAEGIYPYDVASCGACLSQHESGLCCSRRDHAELREAASEAGLVKLVGKLRKTTYAPRIAEIRKTFLRLRTKHRKFWTRKAKA